MQRYVASQAAHLVVGVLGAVLVAAAVAAVGDPQTHNLPDFLAAFGSRLIAFAQFKLGASATSGAPVLDELAGHLPPTLALLGMGIGVALLVGVPAGLLSAFGAARRIGAPLVQVVTATPVFCAGLALAFAAVHLLGWPVSINAAIGTMVTPGEVLPITLLPALTVGLAGAAAVQLALRRSADQTSSNSFRNGLRRMGLGSFEIETRFVLPQVLTGLLTGAGEIMLALLSATVVAEWVFHRTGAADLFVKSVALADWNMAAILLLVFSTLTFAATFLGNVLARLTGNTQNGEPPQEMPMIGLALRALGWFGLGLLTLAVFLSDFLAREPAGAISVGAILNAPSPAHPFGTDQLGRDVFSETLHGLAATGVTAVEAAAIAIVLGGLLGAVAARLPRPLALILRGFWGILAAAPALLLAILLIGLAGNGLAAIAAGLAATPIAFLRAFDSVDLNSRHGEYARATGISGTTLLKRDLTYKFRTMIGRVLARALAAVTILISTVSFLGFGGQPTGRDLGLMIAAAKISYLSAWWTAAFPALALVLIVLCARLAAGLDEGERA
jgi:ABC-type dipeptide/oligopeptide/nickel transport system permease subunit